MVIREAGLLFRGFTLIKKSYHKTDLGKIDKDLRSGLLTAILNFAETAFSKGAIEYFEGKKYVIAFTNSQIVAEDGIGPEILISYAILDKEKKIDKYINKFITPMLIKVAEEFKLMYSNKNLSEITQFREFKKDLDAIFKADAENIDQKLKGVFY